MTERVVVGTPRCVVHDVLCWSFKWKIDPRYVDASVFGIVFKQLVFSPDRVFNLKGTVVPRTVFNVICDFANDTKLLNAPFSLSGANLAFVLRTQGS